MRLLALRLLVYFGAIATLLTELLGACGWLRRGPLTLAWLLVAGAAAVVLRR